MTLWQDKTQAAAVEVKPTPNTNLWQAPPNNKDLFPAHPEGVLGLEKDPKNKIW